MRRPSFQFYPADWEGTRWVSFTVQLPYLMPMLPACYVVYRGDDAVYVGQTSNLRKRFQNYNFRPGYGGGMNTPWGWWDEEDATVKARFASKFGDWASRELRLIRRLQPELNCVGSTRIRGAQ